MSYIPADTAVLNEVENRLRNVTTNNGYNNEIKKIKRAKMTPFKGHDLPACNIYHGTVESATTPYGSGSKRQFLIIEAHDKTRDIPFVDIADSLAADIVMAMFRATTAPKVSDPVDIKLGGIVQGFTFLGHDPFIGQGAEPFCGTLIRFEVKYENETGDMINFI